MANVKLAVKDLALAESIPGLCAGCGTPTTETEERYYLVGFRQKLTFDLPYCTGCRTEHRAYERNGLWLGIGIFVAVIGLVLGIVLQVLVHILALSLALFALVPVGGVMVLRAFMKRRKPSTCTATIIDADEKRISMVDVHDQFVAALEVLRKRKVGGPKK
jgi:hypothetical protein